MKNQTKKTAKVESTSVNNESVSIPAAADTTVVSTPASIPTIARTPFAKSVICNEEHLELDFDNAVCVILEYRSPKKRLQAAEERAKAAHVAADAVPATQAKDKADANRRATRADDLVSEIRCDNNAREAKAHGEVKIKVKFTNSKGEKSAFVTWAEATVGGLYVGKTYRVALTVEDGQILRESIRFDNKPVK